MNARLGLVVCLVIANTLFAKAPTGDLETRSLPLRTALHHDPALAVPLDELVRLYRGAGRVDALLSMYRSHLAQYPSDAGAETVLVRLLISVGDLGARDEAFRAVERFPDNAYLHFLLHQVLKTGHDAGALDELDRAIQLEKDPSRKLAWIDELLPLATAQDRRDMAQKHLQELASLADSPERRLEVARKMNRFHFHEPALELLGKEEAASPETMVQIELEAATAESGLQRKQAASARLARLLGKLAPDYWRRAEIVSRRLAMVEAEDERQAMIQEARKKVAARPRDEAAVLDLAQMLSGFGHRREALDVLVEAGRRLPGSAAVEKQTLELFDALHDDRGREQYLAGLLAAQPDRQDLALLHVKTLFVLGRKDDALSKLAAVTDRLPPAEATVQTLELARYLRRASLTAEAAALFRRVVEKEPARLDVRRELAEALLALGERRQLRELFSGNLSEQAELENLLDLVRFMLQQDLLVEAEGVLAGRLARDAENFDLRLLLVDVQRRLGDRQEGERLIAESRNLADTVARYRRWLESAVALFDEFDAAETFLDAERARLDGEPPDWTGPWLDRRLALAELAARHGRRAETAAMLEDDLAADPPQSVRAKIRRQLIAALESDQTATAVLSEHLEQLVQEDPQYADEGNLRLALLYAKSGRHDLAEPLLSNVHVARINDVALLNALTTFQAERGGRLDRILAALERLVELDPTNKTHWQRWLTMLAGQGDEERLSANLRRLLAGVEKLPLSEETRELLGEHLADTQWRAVARLLISEKLDASRILPLLESAERSGREGHEWIWIAWARAYVRNRLGQTKARDEAIAELRRLVAGSSQEQEQHPPRIVFPDGMSVSLEHAVRLLTEPPGSAPPDITAPRGPLPGLSVRWTFDTRRAVPVTAIVPLCDDRVLIADQSGNACCLDAATGKLVWQRESLVPSTPAPTPPAVNPFSSYSGYSGRPVAPAPPPVLVADGQGRFYTPGAGEVACYAADDGRLLWRAAVGAVKPASASPVLPVSPYSPAVYSPPVVSVFFCDPHVVTYDPLSGTVIKIDPASGKIVWERVIAADKPMPLGGHNSGASLSGRRLLVYGSQAAILDVPSGDVEWSFEPQRVRSHPIELRGPDESAATASSTPAATPIVPYAPMYYAAGSRMISVSRSLPGVPQPAPAVDYLGPSRLPAAFGGGMRLTSTAVAWASQVEQGQPREGYLAGPWLLLSDPSGFRAVHVGLPLSGQYFPAMSGLVGMVGHRACTLSGSQLQLVDVSQKTVTTYPLQDLLGPPGATRQLVLDGPRLYGSGPGGILCLNVLTGQWIFRAPWPPEIAPTAPSALAAPAVLAQMPAVYGGYSGMVGYPGGPAASSLRQAASRIACVDRNVFYTLVEPGRVVALAGEDADGR